MRWHRDQSTQKYILPALAVIALSILVTMVAIADNAQKSDKTDTGSADIKVPVAGMQVSIDPVTGRLRPPTAEESRALARALRQQFAVPAQPLQVIQAANGALAVELPEDMMETVVLRTHADGTQTLECMSAAEAALLMEGEASSAQQDEAKPVPPRRRSSNQNAEKE